MSLVEDMDRVESGAHVEAVLAPVDGPSGVGQEVAGSTDYAWLDEELMKVGSLRHGQIDWAGAESRAIRLLCEAGKDIRVLAHLLHCLQQERDPARFEVSLRLLSGALDTWWENAYPRPGEPGKALRRKLFGTIMQRAVHLAAGLPAGTKCGYKEHLDILEQLQEKARAAGLPVDPLEELEQTLTRLAAAAPEGPGELEEEHGPTPPERAPLSADQGSALAGIELRTGDERGQREALLRVADHLAAQAPDQPIGYRLRRYAVWAPIDGVPATRDGQRTELAAVAADRMAEYREGAERGGNHALWQRLEKSLAVSPFWLEGQRLSATLAQRLGFDDCADAIHEETVRFVTRLPGLVELQFSDGTAFADETTRQWLARAGGTESSGLPAADAPWQQALAEARSCLDQDDGLNTALSILDRGLAAARSPRDEAYWRLASADLLGEAGLEALSRQQYRAVQAVIEDLALEHWEPQLVQRLKAAGAGCRN